MLSPMGFANLIVPLKEDTNDDQVDDSIADARSWLGNRNDSKRPGLVGWL